MDVLVTHCAPALMRRNNDRDDLYYEDGTIAIWRWLGFDRFFPEGRKAAQVMRGCASVSFPRADFIGPVFTFYTGLSRKL